MPSIEMKVESQSAKVSQSDAPNAGDEGNAAKQITLLLEKKIRNLEKRKQKLESLKHEAKKGKKLEPDQLEAIEHLSEVMCQTDFAKDFLKGVQSIVQETSKFAKQQKKAELREKQQEEQKKFSEWIKLQDVLNSLGDATTRQDFMDGSNGAMKLTKEKLEQLDSVYTLIAPERSEIVGAGGSWQDAVEAASRHCQLLISGSNRPVMTSDDEKSVKILENVSYKELRKMLSSVADCGYFEPARSESPQQSENSGSCSVSGDENTTTVTVSETQARVGGDGAGSDIVDQMNSVAVTSSTSGGDSVGGAAETGQPHSQAPLPPRQHRQSESRQMQQQQQQEASPSEQQFVNGAGSHQHGSSNQPGMEADVDGSGAYSGVPPGTLQQPGSGINAPPISDMFLQDDQNYQFVTQEQRMAMAGGSGSVHVPPVSQQIPAPDQASAFVSQNVHYSATENVITSGVAQQHNSQAPATGSSDGFNGQHTGSAHIHGNDFTPYNNSDLSTSSTSMYQWSSQQQQQAPHQSAQSNMNPSAGQSVMSHPSVPAHDAQQQQIQQQPDHTEQQFSDYQQQQNQRGYQQRGGGGGSGYGGNRGGGRGGGAYYRGGPGGPRGGPGGNDRGNYRGGPRGGAMGGGGGAFRGGGPGMPRGGGGGAAGGNMGRGGGNYRGGGPPRGVGPRGGGGQYQQSGGGNQWRG